MAATHVHLQRCVGTASRRGSALPRAENCATLAHMTTTKRGRPALMDIILITITVMVATVIVVYTLLNGIGPVPTNRRVLSCIDHCLPERVPGDVLELGAGWGGVALHLAKKYPDNRVVAVENCPPVWLFCWLRAKCSRQSNLTVQYGNIYKQNVNNAGLVYCYLYPQAMERMAPILHHIQPGGLIISQAFHLPGWRAHATHQAADLWHSPVYCYTQKS